MEKQITNKVSWVGKVDWELKKFHGDEFRTNRGSTYNSYLIKDEKITLIDTAWIQYDKEFITNLKNEIDIKKIDYIIALHGEIDHSGSLLELMREIPQTPIYCTENAVKSIKGQYHKEWNFITVKTGDKLNIGESTITFIEAPMLHWPDTMFAYLDKENILFSSDAFGEHFASEFLYAHQVPEKELEEEMIKYYANILSPFSTLVNRKIKDILDMKLPISMICPSHGLILKGDLTQQVMEKYLKWSSTYEENQITILYDTMWNNTRKMAEAIATGIQKKDQEVTIRIMNTSKEDKTDVLTEVFKSKMIVVGSSTINNGILYSIAGILEMIKGMKLKKKEAVAFGSYGWSGEAVKIINEELIKSGFILKNEGLKLMWTPDKKQIDQCIEFGKSLV